MPRNIVANPVKKPSARIWPSRDFTLGYSLAGLEDIFHEPTVVIDGNPVPLGSSNRLNSHKSPENCGRFSSNRARRGQNGLTPHGKLLVKNSAAYLQERYGRQHLSFATVTIPSVSAEESREISQNWSEILRRFQQSLTRKLKSEGLPQLLVGVTEIQAARFERDGVLGLHYHCVFVGRRPRCDWAVHYLEIREMWRRSFPSKYQTLDFSSSENVVRVKSAVDKYLSKYISKGVPVLGDSAQIEEFRDVLPTTWYNCTNNLRRVIKSMVLSGASSSDAVALIVEHAVPECLEFLMPIYVVIDDYEFIAGWRGKLTRDAYKILYESCSPRLDEVGETFPQKMRPGKFSGF